MTATRRTINKPGCVVTCLFRLDFIFQLRHSTRVPGKFVDPLLILVCNVHIFNRLQTWKEMLSYLLGASQYKIWHRFIHLNAS